MTLVQHPYLFVAGCSLLGLVIPTWVAALAPQNVVMPNGNYAVATLSAALISASFVL